MLKVGVCDVCGLRKSIGVASTSVPYSCAYCECCAIYGADPEFVFEYWFEEIGAPENHRCPGLSLTWKDGQYVNYTEWYKRRTLLCASPSTLSNATTETSNSTG